MNLISYYHIYLYSKEIPFLILPITKKFHLLSSFRFLLILRILNHKETMQCNRPQHINSISLPYIHLFSCFLYILVIYFTSLHYYFTFFSLFLKPLFLPHIPPLFLQYLLTFCYNSFATDISLQKTKTAFVRGEKKPRIYVFPGILDEITGIATDSHLFCSESVNKHWPQREFDSILASILWVDLDSLFFPLIRNIRYFIKYLDCC